MSEWVGGHRQFVSGFIESAGLALITKNEARLWTDSRYFLQDTHQLNNQQQLMRMEEDPAVDIWMADKSVGTDLQCQGNAFYTQMELDEVRDEWACHVLEWI